MGGGRLVQIGLGGLGCGGPGGEQQRAVVVAVDVNVVIKVSGAQIDAGAPLQGGEEGHGDVGADARQHRHAVVVLHRWIQVVRTVAIQVRRLRARVFYQLERGSLFVIRPF